MFLLVLDDDTKIYAPVRLNSAMCVQWPGNESQPAGEIQLCEFYAKGENPNEGCELIMQAIDEILPEKLVSGYAALDLECLALIDGIESGDVYVEDEYKSEIMKTDEPSLLSEALTPTKSVSPRKAMNVVLVDAHLRRSQIVARYGMRVLEGSGQGLTHFLAGMCPLSEVVYQTNVPGACIIPVGREVSNSLVLLSTPRLQRMLEQLRQKFDFVLVDAPPVGVIIDAAEIAKFCDGTILGVKYNAISRRELMEAKAQLERTGCQILGAVLNSVAFDTISSKKYYNRHYFTNYDSDYYKSAQSGKKRSGQKTAKGK